MQPPCAQSSYRYPGSATSDGTWTFGEAFRNDKGERGTGSDHYTSVFYMQGSNGAAAAGGCAWQQQELSSSTLRACACEQQLSSDSNGHRLAGEDTLLLSSLGAGS